MIFQQQKQAGVEENIAGTKGSEANAALQSGDAKRAAELYREVITEDPRNPRTYYNLALALRRLGDVPAERESLEKALALDPGFAAALNQIGLLDLDAGRPAEAERRFKA